MMRNLIDRFPDRRVLARIALHGLVALAGCTTAVVSMAAVADDDLPGRVGRVANVQGTLQHSPDDNPGDWSPIGLNYPIAQGANLFAEHGAVAEVDYGGGQFRLAGDTNLHVSRLDERQLALFVAAGRVIVRVRVLEPDDSVRIDTPAGQIALVRPGLYRVDVASDSPLTVVLVREGEAQVLTSTGTDSVMPGETLSVTGVGNESPVVRYGGSMDGFDTWSAARDRVYEAPRNNDYVSRQMIGQADLDAYGAWQSFPDYGAVWFPTVDPEWAPYRFGYWTWLSGWGYTWVDQAPWGYAPFHYGRWAYIAGRWGWCPGTYVARPLWAPALVAWYGGGSVYGWVPLGWREPFIPWWNRCTDRCYGRYNRPYAVNVAERRDAPPAHYANWRVQGGVTAVPGAALMRGAPVAANRVSLRTDAAAPLAHPPAFKPTAPAPAVRAARGLPPPASTLDVARSPIASGNQGAMAPVVPPAGYRTSMPRPGVGRSAPMASSAAAQTPLRIDDGRNAVPPVASPAAQTPLRIDDGRNVLRPVAPPSPSARPAPPAERTFHSAPLPQRSPSPSVIPAVAPPPAATLAVTAPAAPPLPHVVPRVSPAPAVTPAPPAVLPAPVPPPALAPVPAAVPPVQIAPQPPPPQPVQSSAPARGAPGRSLRD